MNKEKHTLSVTQKYTLRYIINGCLWLIYSFFNLIPSKPIEILGTVLLLISTVCSFYVVLGKQESDDEMSIQHINLAKSLCLDILICSIMVAGIVSNFVSIPFYQTYGFLIAASHIISGLLFLKYEKEGC